MNESAILAEYVANTVYEDLPARAAEMAKMSLLDALGVTLAAGGLCAECSAFVEIAGFSRPSPGAYGGLCQRRYGACP